MTHQEVRQRVSRGIEDQIAALRQVAATRRLFEIGIFVLMAVAGVAIVLFSRAQLPLLGAYVGWIAGTLLVALAVNAMVLLMHEGMHNILFRNGLANRLVSTALGACFLMSFTAYRVMHIRHHYFLGDPRDPDDYHNYTDSPRRVWAMHYLRLSLGSFLYLLIIPGLAYRYGDTGERRRMLSEYALLALIYALVLTTIPGEALLWAWLVPLILVGLMTNIRGFSQHAMTDVSDPCLASRSIRSNRVVSFLLLNENLHLEHHLFPEIPSHNLPALSRLIEPRLPRRVSGDSYLGFLLTFLKRTVRLDESTVGLDDEALLR